MSQKPKHIMELIPEFRRIVEKLETIKNTIVKKSGIEYTSQDARMVALDSLQISISAVGMWIQCCNSLANFHTKEGLFKYIGISKNQFYVFFVHDMEKLM